MDMTTKIVGGALLLLLIWFLLQLSYTILINLINGRKFHHALLQDFNKLRLSKMLAALGINKAEYIHQTNLNDIHKHMKSCSACENTDECDDKLSKPDLEANKIGFCNNEAELKEMLDAKKAEASD